VGARLRIAVVGACLIASLAAAPSAHATFPGTNGKIAFSCGDGICVVSPDGSGRTQITHNPFR
jgi:hypothetical protein